MTSSDTGVTSSDSGAGVDRWFPLARTEILGVKPAATTASAREAAAFRYWLETGRIEPGYGARWLEIIRRTVGGSGEVPGVPVRRLRLWPGTRTEYHGFLLDGLRLCAQAGEDVRIVPAADHPPHRHVLWLLDRSTALTADPRASHPVVTERPATGADRYWARVAETASTLAGYLTQEAAR